MTVSAAAQTLLDRIAAEVASARPFRATVTAVSGQLVQLQRPGESAGAAELYATCTRFVLYAGDVVLCLPLGEKSAVVIDVIRTSATVAPTIAADAAAGTTASVAISGRDDAMQIQVIPGGTGIATGSVLTVTFAAAMATSSYVVEVTPNSSAARTLGGVVGPTARNTAGFDLATNTALTSGSTYQWLCATKPYA